MSYYKKITDYVLTYHAQRRIKERMIIDHVPEYDIYAYIEELIKYSVVDMICENGDVKLINHEQKISFIMRGNIIKTVINHKIKRR